MTFMDVKLSGAELAEYLADHLSDLEFELLVRKRINKQFATAQAVYPQFEDNHNTCRYEHSWNDKSDWQVRIGSTYRDCVSLNGEVLSTTLHNAVRQYDMQNNNKLSKLLPPPTPDHDAFDL